MVTEDYVSFETAKLLKEKGFDGLCTAYYDCFTTDNFHCGNEPTDFNGIDTKIRDIVAAPTLQMTMKWLREIHNITIGVLFQKNRIYYEVSKNGNIIVGIDTPLSYENVCETAIKYCLESLI